MTTLTGSLADDGSSISGLSGVDTPPPPPPGRSSSSSSEGIIITLKPRASAALAKLNAESSGMTLKQAFITFITVSTSLSVKSSTLPFILLFICFLIFSTFASETVRSSPIFCVKIPIVRTKCFYHHRLA